MDHEEGDGDERAVRSERPGRCDTRGPEHQRHRRCSKVRGLRLDVFGAVRPRRDARGVDPGAEVRIPGGGCGKLDPWSKVFWFNAKRTAEQYAEGPPLRIIALCDIGFKESDSVVELLTQEVHGEQPPDAWVQCGDFAYDLDDENGGVGDKFMKAMEPIAAYVPWMTSAGNHEASHNFTHYRERFTMPDRSKTDNHYYSS